jgi:transposase
MTSGITYVGLDAHKNSISVAMLLPRKRKVVEWTVANEPKALRRMVKKLAREAPGEVRCCYEAGPCGYALKRTIETGSEVVCEVIAPSLIPVKPGERIKTDRRDASKLAELFRAGLLTEVQPPTAQEEAVRDLCRCREDAKEDQTRARHRLSKLLLRRGLVYSQGKNWTSVHRKWLRSIKWEHAADQAVFDDYMQALEHVEERLKALDAKLEEASQEAPYAQPVAWLRCFRGIDTVTAMTIVAELHGFSRFESPRALMSYLGLVPSEHSSGDTKRRGTITKTGNKHVRRILIEAAWHYRHAPAVGARLRKRRHGQPGHVIAIADRAQSRLHRRYWRLISGSNKPHNKAVTAVARELVGFIWAALYPAATEAAHA